MKIFVFKLVCHILPQIKNTYFIFSFIKANACNWSYCDNKTNRSYAKLEISQNFSFTRPASLVSQRKPLELFINHILVAENCVVLKSIIHELPHNLCSLCGQYILHFFNTLRTSAFQKCMMSGRDCWLLF